MLVGAQGRQGAGKTRFITILGILLKTKSKMKLYANYKLFGVEYINVNSLKELKQIQSGIVLLDEMWLSVDSRRSMGNVDFTGLIAQLRKKNIIAIFTTQQISKLDVRVRDATDYLFHCDKDNSLIVVDYQYGIIIRKYFMNDPSFFNQFYDTYQSMESMKA